MLRKRKISCLLVTHAAEEAIALAGRALLMAGRPGTILGEYRIDDDNSPRSDAANDLRAAIARIAG
jgi:ABC-type nitrate/sulfonate/bicarbonate transport system ATPase subunit